VVGGTRIFPEEITPEVIELWIFRVVAVLLGFTVHELCHAWSAYKLGDPTAWAQGRISLNPLRHLDPIGAIAAFLVGFGWAKPVEIQPANFRHPLRDGVLVSLAGPAANLLTAVLFGLTLRLTPYLPAMNSSALIVVVNLVYVIVMINLGLFIFNLIPIPPLDGSHVLRGALPLRWRLEYEKLYPYGTWLMLVIIVIPSYMNGKFLAYTIGAPRDWLYALITGL
jgi:Zn-dependent protease